MNISELMNHTRKLLPRAASIQMKSSMAAAAQTDERYAGYPPHAVLSPWFQSASGAHCPNGDVAAIVFVRGKIRRKPFALPKSADPPDQFSVGMYELSGRLYQTGLNPGERDRRIKLHEICSTTSLPFKENDHRSTCRKHYTGGGIGVHHPH